MRTQDVSRGAKCVAYLIIGATIAACTAPALLCPVEELPRARPANA